jgi:hypothetical protein
MSAGLLPRNAGGQRRSNARRRSKLCCCGQAPLYHGDLDFIVEQLDWDGNVDPRFKENHYLEPVTVADTRSEGYADRWIVYVARSTANSCSLPREFTVEPGVKAIIKDAGAHGLVCVQGTGKINGLPLSSPELIRFRQLSEDEYFATEDGARAGISYENTSETEPLVTLRYFGPGVNPDAPEIGAYKTNKPSDKTANYELGKKSSALR